MFEKVGEVEGVKVAHFAAIRLIREGILRARVDTSSSTGICPGKRHTVPYGG
jgi:hypothetical protein